MKILSWVGNLDKVFLSVTICDQFSSPSQYYFSGTHEKNPDSMAFDSLCIFICIFPCVYRECWFNAQLNSSGPVRPSKRLTMVRLLSRNQWLGLAKHIKRTFYYFQCTNSSVISTLYVLDIEIFLVNYVLFLTLHWSSDPTRHQARFFCMCVPTTRQCTVAEAQGTETWLRESKR